jgi:putative membrane protein
MGFLIRLLLKIAFTAFGLWVASHALHLIRITGTEALILAAIVLGLVNAFIRPILIVLTLPLTILTLGLFLLIINGLMIWLMGYLLKGYGVHTDNLFDSVLAALVVGVISWIGHLLVGEGRAQTRRR